LSDNSFSKIQNSGIMLRHGIEVNILDSDDRADDPRRLPLSERGRRLSGPASPQPLENACFGKGDPRESKPFLWGDLAGSPAGFAGFG
jgi:hypothetical protein